MISDDDTDNPGDNVAAEESPSPSSTSTELLDIDGKISSWSRLVSALPNTNFASSTSASSELDRRILSTAIPTMLNFMVVPLVNAVDTFYVGQLADPLALAAQAAANQCFFSIYFIAAFLPTITAPLVAGAIGKGDWDTAKERVCESLFLSNVLGGLFSILLIAFPQVVLRLVLPSSLTDASSAVIGTGMSVMDYAIPYLRWRALGMIPALFSATGFAAYRGLLNTVTPMKVSLTTNLLNLVLDPLFIFGLGRSGGVNNSGSFLLCKVATGLGAAGAAAATSVAELTSSLIYLRLLIRRRLIQWSKLFKPPSMKSLLPLIQGGLAMLLRQATLNVAFVSAARRAQEMDPSGVSAAAYGITMQIYSLGVVAHLGVQGTAAALIPSSRAMGGDDAARKVADRIFAWGTILGVILASVQWFALPMITPLFSPLAEVRTAVKGPAAISSFIHLVNGLVFAGEGAMLGLGMFRDLALITALGVGVMISCLSSPLGKTLNGVLMSLAAFNLIQGIAVTIHHVRMSPLRRRGFFQKSTSHQEEVV
jgi:putative MATE family efflux protein